MRPRPKADVCIAAGPTLKSPSRARVVLAELERRQAGKEHDCHSAPSIPGTSRVDELGPAEAAGAAPAPRPFRSFRGTSRPGRAFIIYHKARFQKAALGRAPGPRSRALTPSSPLFWGVDTPLSSSLNSSQGTEGRQV